MFSTVNIPRSLPNGYTLSALTADNERMGPNNPTTLFSHFVISERGFNSAICTLNLNGKDYKVNIRSGESLLINIAQNIEVFKNTRVYLESPPVIFFSECLGLEVSYRDKTERIRMNTAHVSILPSTQKFLLTDKQNPVESAILQKKQQVLENGGIVVLEKNTHGNCYQGRLETFRTHSHKLQKKQIIKSMAADGLYIGKCSENPERQILECRRCYFKKGLLPAKNNWEELNNKHKKIHEQAESDLKTTDATRHNKITAVTMNGKELPCFEVTDKLPGYQDIESTRHRCEEQLVVPSMSAYIDMHELFSDDYEGSMIKETLKPYKELVSSIQTGHEDKIKTARSLGDSLPPEATPPSFMTCALNLEPPLKMLLKMIKMVDIANQPNHQENHPAKASTLEQLKMDIQRHLIIMQRILNDHKPLLEANEIDKPLSLLYLVSESSHLEAEGNSGKEAEGNSGKEAEGNSGKEAEGNSGKEEKENSGIDLLPGKCRKRAELGTDLLGAITKEIVNPLMEYPETEDLYYTHLAALVGDPNSDKFDIHN